MLELGRKEAHLFSGIFVQILMVGLLVFAYTQAIRQVKHARELYYRYQEQLTMAREQMARQPPGSDPAALQAEVDRIKRRFAAEPDLLREKGWIERVARQEFHLQDLQLRKSEMPVEILTFPMKGRPDFEVQLYGLELTAAGTTRSAAGLLAALAEPELEPILALAALDLRASQAAAAEPVQWSARWLVPVVPGPAREEVPLPPPQGTRLDWGNREEPFSSPLQHPSAVRPPAGKGDSIRLTGIVWDPVTPACVINQRVLRPGEWVESYQVVLITPETVILQGLDEEILLHLP